MDNKLVTASHQITAVNDLTWQRYGFPRAPIFLVSKDGSIEPKDEEDARIVELVKRKKKLKLISSNLELPVTFEDPDSVIDPHYEAGKPLALGINNGKIFKVD